MPNNTLLRDDGIILNQYIGDQTRQAVHEVVGATEELIQKLRSEKKTVRILADLTQIGRTPPESREESIAALNAFSYDKVATFGGSVLIQDLINLIIMTMHKDWKVRSFRVEQDAVAWLNQRD